MKSVTIRVNGAKREVPDGTTLEKLVELFQLKKKSIVLELNHQVIDRNTYSTAQIKEDDTVEIVHFVGGG